MDRRSRRFVPSSEGLEGRQLMSTTSSPVAASVANPAGSASGGVQVDESAPAQQTIESKRHRIHNLPFFIGMLNKDGVIPQPAVQNIQNDLNQLVAQLHQGNSSLISAFNRASWWGMASGWLAPRRTTSSAANGPSPFTC